MQRRRESTCTNYLLEVPSTSTGKGSHPSSTVPGEASCLASARASRPASFEGQWQTARFSDSHERGTAATQSFSCGNFTTANFFILYREEAVKIGVMFTNCISCSRAPQGAAHAPPVTNKYGPRFAVTSGPAVSRHILLRLRYHSHHVN